MAAQFLSLLAVFCLQAQPGPAITGTVIDEGGKPLADVELLLSFGMAAGGSVPILDRTKSDAQGAFRLPIPPPEKRRGLGRFADVWAFRPGWALGAESEYLLEGSEPDPFRIVLRPAGKRIVTVLDGAGKPLSGARTEIRAIHFPSTHTNMASEFLPDELAARLAVTSGGDGKAEFSWIANRDQFVAGRVTVPDFASYDVLLARRLSDSGQRDTGGLTVTIKAGGMLTGKVEDESGKPVADQPLQIWAKGDGWLASTPVQLTGTPLRTTASGEYRTPTVLLQGAEYRVVVRSAGAETALSSWIKIADNTKNVPTLVVRRLRNVRGRVIDRQGKPVTGARVFQSGDGPEPRSTSTDEHGHFVLDGFPARNAFLFVRLESFRFHGQMLAGDDGPIEVVLSRLTEPPQRILAPLADLVSIEESRALALKVIGPYLDAALARGDETAKAFALYVPALADPGGTLERLSSIKFQNPSALAMVQRRIAVALAASDPDEAAAVAESMSTPENRAGTLVDVSDAEPAADRVRKLALLDRALLQARGSTRLVDRVHQMCEVAVRWNELGEHERATSLMKECRNLGEQLTGVVDPMRVYFGSRLAEFDLPGALEQVAKIRSKDQAQEALGNIVGSLAATSPQNCERVLGMFENRIARSVALMRVCQRMAASDPARAQRLAATAQGEQFQVKVPLFLALGLKDRDRTSALSSFCKGMARLDRLADAHHEVLPCWDLAALAILAEQIDPMLISEVFWRALAARPPSGDPRTENDGALAVLAMFVSRYDREAAAALLCPIVAELEGLHDSSSRRVIDFLALALLDPRRAAMLIEKIPITSDLSSGANWVRIRVAELLASSREARWRSVWRLHSSVGATLFDRDFR